MMRWLLFLLLVLASTACVPNSRGMVTPSGYSHKDYSYQVTTRKDGSLVSQGWILDNYALKAGRQTSSKIRPNEPASQHPDELVAKDEGRYRTTYRIDTDGDGDYETKKGGLTFDLRFTHENHDGVIFLRTFPISQNEEKKRPDVLMGRLIDQVAGAGYEAVEIRADSVVLLEKRYAAKIVQKGPAKLAGREAYSAVIDIANLDQIKVDPSLVEDRMELLLMHTPFSYEVSSSTVAGGQGVKKLPVLLLAGYRNRPEDFEEGLSEFHDLLARIHIERVSGFEPSVTIQEEQVTQLSAGASPAIESEPTSPEAVDAAEVEASEPGEPISD